MGRRLQATSLWRCELTDVCWVNLVAPPIERRRRLRPFPSPLSGTAHQATHPASSKNAPGKSTTGQPTAPASVSSDPSVNELRSAVKSRWGRTASPPDSKDSRLVPGDIMFYSLRNPRSWVLRRSARSRYSHIAVYVGNGFLVDETLLHGICLQPIHSWTTRRFHAIDIGRLESEEMRSRLVEAALAGQRRIGLVEDAIRTLGLIFQKNRGGRPTLPK